MSYTPKEIAGLLYFEQLEDKRELHERLTIAAMGARGDEKALKQTLKRLAKGDS